MRAESTGNSESERPADEQLVGRVLDGRYALTAELGEGGMGVVYRGHHATTERPVAVKVLRRHLTADPRISRRFVREAKAAAGLRHPHVVDVLDYGVTSDGIAFQVLELLEGESLRELLERREVLDAERALEVLLPVMDALSAAHEAGVVHRDLKPDNIFIAKDALGRTVPKVLDFGIAKVMPREGANGGTFATHVGAVMGTPSYMSPEQARGATAEIGPATDVWAFGVILFECLSGRLPYEADTPSMVMARVMMEDPPSLGIYEGVPAPIVEVVDGALRKTIEERHASMSAMIEALRAAAASAGIATPDPRAPEGRPLTSRPPPPRESMPELGLEPTVARSTPPPVTAEDASTIVAKPRKREAAAPEAANLAEAPRVDANSAEVATSRGGVSPILLAGLAAGALLALVAGGLGVAALLDDEAPTAATPTAAPALEPAIQPEAETETEPEPVAELAPPTDEPPAVEAPVVEEAPTPTAHEPTDTRPPATARRSRARPETTPPDPPAEREPRPTEPRRAGALPELSGW
ncbi:MAG: protein kinase [Sandaracinaceae bacterium]|nr:protein kinase [Sandaracinaceae bacterium]